MPTDPPEKRRTCFAEFEHTLSEDDVLAEAREAGSITSFNFDPPTLSDMFREAVQQ